MKVLSIFDGISCARIALERAGFEIDQYYASETDKYAIQIAQKNYPNTIQLGCVKDITKDKVGKIDLFIGGSPCQDLSVAKNNRQGLDGEQSGLFWEYVRILKEVKPKYFILENVASMRKEDRDVISKTLGVEPIMIDAFQFSAQQRKRLFWANIKIEKLPYNKEIILKDILEDDVDDKYYLTNEQIEIAKENRKSKIFKTGKRRGPMMLVRKDKALCLTTSCGITNRTTNLVQDTKGVRKLTPIEYERLQCVNDNYTKDLSDTQRYKCLGNGFNVDVITHILSFMA